MTKNIRFWDYTASPVKITLSPGQKLTYKKYETDDEGWILKNITWEYIDNILICVIYTDGVDCDGRLSSIQAFSCEIEDLFSGGVNEELNIKYPKWNLLNCSQRDYSAESMGY